MERTPKALEPGIPGLWGLVMDHFGNHRSVRLRVLPTYGPCREEKRPRPATAERGLPDPI